MVLGGTGRMSRVDPMNMMCDHSVCYTYWKGEREGGLVVDLEGLISYWVWKGSIE